MSKAKKNDGLIVFFPGGEIGWCEGRGSLVSLIKEKISNDKRSSLHVVKFSTVLQLPLEGKKYILNPKVTALSSLIECQISSLGIDPLISLRKKQPDGKESGQRKKV